MRSIVLLASSLVAVVFAIVTCATNQPCSNWTSQSSCISYKDPASNQTCVWNGTTCQAPSTAVQCTSYTTSSTCAAATDPVSGLNCSWNGTACVRPAYCSHNACSAFTTQATCVAPTINAVAACSWTTDIYGVHTCASANASACIGFTTQTTCTANSNFCTWNP